MNKECLLHSSFILHIFHCFEQCQAGIIDVVGNERSIEPGIQNFRSLVGSNSDLYGKFQVLGFRC